MRFSLVVGVESYRLVLGYIPKKICTFELINISNIIWLSSKYDLVISLLDFVPIKEKISSEYTVLGILSAF